MPLFCLLKHLFPPITLLLQAFSLTLSRTHVFNGNRPKPHRIGRHEVQLLQAPVGIGQDIDGRRQAGHACWRSH